ncbi:vesicle-associated protein 1-3, partial [Quercus suber]
FNKESGKAVEEFKLRVSYIPANPPSPVPEEPEEVSSPRASSVLENGHQNRSLFDAVSRSLEEPNEKSSEAWSLISKLTEEKSSALQQNQKLRQELAWSLISKLTEEKSSALQQNQKLRQELDIMRKEISKSRAGGFSLLIVVLVGLIGILAGYFVK